MGGPVAPPADGRRLHKKDSSLSSSLLDTALIELTSETSRKPVYISAEKVSMLLFCAGFMGFSR